MFWLKLIICIIYPCFGYCNQAKMKTKLIKQMRLKDTRFFFKLLTLLCNIEKP